jgi:hypothetical protein
MEGYGTINWFAVLLVTIISFPFGALWHSNLMFGKAWKEEVHLKVPDKKDMNMPLIFGTAFVCNLISVIGLAMWVGADTGLWAGAHKGLFLSFFFVSSALGVTYVFAQRSLRLFLIDAGFFVVFYPVAGLIFAAWH